MGIFLNFLSSGTQTLIFTWIVFLRANVRAEISRLSSPQPPPSLETHSSFHDLFMLSCSEVRTGTDRGVKRLHHDRPSASISPTHQLVSRQKPVSTLWRRFGLPEHEVEHCSSFKLLLSLSWRSSSVEICFVEIPVFTFYSK